MGRNGFSVIRATIGEATINDLRAICEAVAGVSEIFGTPHPFLALTSFWRRASSSNAACAGTCRGRRHLFCLLGDAFEVGGATFYDIYDMYLE